MRKFLARITSFFQGRYGFDSLSYFLLFLSILFSILGIFFLSEVFYIIDIILYGFVIYRCFSKNFVLRANENRRFLGIFRSIKSFFSLQKRIFKDRKTHVYRTCPKCKATIRLPKKKGSHTVRCPKCSERFDVKI